MQHSSIVVVIETYYVTLHNYNEMLPSKAYCIFNLLEELDGKCQSGGNLTEKGGA